MTEWVKAGAPPGGYAAGAYIGIRCDEPQLANQGPLGGKYTQYSGVIHCDQIDENAGDPQGQLDSDRAGIWGYYGRVRNTGASSGSARAAGPAISGSTLSKALAKQLMIYLLNSASVSCPALARKQGAAVTCSVAGTDQQDHVEAHGKATVTIQDQSGHKAQDSYRLTEGNGGVINGTGNDFDPDTGRSL